MRYGAAVITMAILAVIACGFFFAAEREQPRLAPIHVVRRQIDTARPELASAMTKSRSAPPRTMHQPVSAASNDLEALDDSILQQDEEGRRLVDRRKLEAVDPYWARTTEQGIKNVYRSIPYISFDDRSYVRCRTDTCQIGTNSLANMSVANSNVMLSGIQGEALRQSMIALGLRPAAFVFTPSHDFTHVTVLYRRIK